MDQQRNDATFAPDEHVESETENMAETSKPHDPIESLLVREDANFAELVAEFVDGLAERLAAMEDAMQAADFEQLRTYAHRLKGSGGGYGYPLLTEHAASLEQCARQKAVDACAEQIEELKRICDRVVVTVQA